MSVSSNEYASQSSQAHENCQIIKDINKVMSKWCKAKPDSALDGLARLRIELKRKPYAKPALEIIDKLIELG